VHIASDHNDDIPIKAAASRDNQQMKIDPIHVIIIIFTLLM
jgi:hypothetical protein